MMGTAATRTTQAAAVKQMLIVALIGWPPETALVFLTTVLHWG